MTLGDVGSVVGACIAVGALVVALLARTDSKVSARASATSAESSGRSASAAEQSLELSRLEQLRRVERSDVEWKAEGGKASEGLIAYRNVGTTTAYAVTVVLTVNDERFDLKFGDIAPNGTVEHDSRDIYERASANHEANRRALSQSGIAYLGTAHFKVGARISWQTEFGTPYIRTL